MGETEVIEFEDEANLYSYQFNAANAAICERRTRFVYSATTEADSIRNACAIERWILKASPVTRRSPLRDRPDAAPPSGLFAALPLSRNLHALGART